MQHSSSNLWRKQCSTSAAQIRAMTSNEQAIYTAMQHSSNSKQCSTTSAIFGERN
jgi:hypothetical protein